MDAQQQHNKALESWDPSKAKVKDPKVVDSLLASSDSSPDTPRSLPLDPHEGLMQRIPGMSDERATKLLEDLGF